eukprot:587260-Rhodomonas_salina.1
MTIRPRIGGSPLGVRDSAPAQGTLKQASTDDVPSRKTFLKRGQGRLGTTVPTSAKTVTPHGRGSAAPTQRSLVLDPPAVPRSVFDSDDDDDERENEGVTDDRPSSYSRIHALKSSNRPTSAPPDNSAKRPVPPKHPKPARPDVDESALHMSEGQRMSSMMRPMQLMRGRAGVPPFTLTGLPLTADLEASSSGGSPPPVEPSVKVASLLSLLLPSSVR